MKQKGGEKEVKHTHMRVIRYYLPITVWLLSTKYWIKYTDERVKANQSITDLSKVFVIFKLH